MELVDRYLQAVRVALPAKQPDDIIQELSDSIYSQIEEKESTLGRPLTDDEQVELLKKLGNPAHLASRYGKPKQLIGPSLFPVYWKVLQLALGLALLVEVIASILTAAAGRSFGASFAPILNYPMVALSVFAWVTLTFAALAFFGTKFRVPDQWDPRQLPPVVKGRARKSRFELVTSLIVGALASVWWLIGLRHPFWIFGPGVFFMTFAPIWLKLYPWFVVLALAEVGRHALEIAKPLATRLHLAARIAIRCLSVVVLFFLIRANEVFVLTLGAAGGRKESVIQSINLATRIGLIAAAVIALAKLAIDVWKLLAGRLEQAHQAALGS